MVPQLRKPIPYVYGPELKKLKDSILNLHFKETVSCTGEPLFAYESRLDGSRLILYYPERCTLKFTTYFYSEFLDLTPEAKLLLPTIFSHLFNLEIKHIVWIV